MYRLFGRQKDGQFGDGSDRRIIWIDGRMEGYRWMDERTDGRTDLNEWMDGQPKGQTDKQLDR